MNLRTRLSLTCLEDRANPSGTMAEPAPSPYDPTLPPAQTAPVPPAGTDPSSAPPYGG